MASAPAATVRRHIVLFEFAPPLERSLPTRSSASRAPPHEPQLLALTTGDVVWADAEGRSEWAWCERRRSANGAASGAGWAPRAYLQEVARACDAEAASAPSTPTLAAFERALAVLQRSDSTRAAAAAAVRAKLEAEAGDGDLPPLPRSCWFSPLVATALCSVRIDELATRLRRLGGGVARWEFIAVVAACFSAATRASFRPDRLKWHLARLFDSLACDGDGGDGAGEYDGDDGDGGSEDGDSEGGVGKAASLAAAVRIGAADVLAVAYVFDGGCVSPGAVAREIFDACAAGAGGVLSEAALERHLRRVFHLYIDTCDGYGAAAPVDRGTPAGAGDPDSERGERAAVLARAVSRHAYSVLPTVTARPSGIRGMRFEAFAGPFYIYSGLLFFCLPFFFLTKSSFVVRSLASCHVGARRSDRSRRLPRL
jgi:hypothetical protein